jgi:hypothetical protein
MVTSDGIVLSSALHESSRRIARSAGFVNPAGAFRDLLIIVSLLEK